MGVGGGGGGEIILHKLIVVKGIFNLFFPTYSITVDCYLHLPTVDWQQQTSSPLTLVKPSRVSMSQP